ncbi:MAG: SDR family NAD(P)-dependent oxidoreductase [Polyangiaceae bacterium]
MTKRALVTGASEGIGLHIARRLAASGYTVTAVARSGAKLDALRGEIGGDSVVADLSTEEGQGAVCDRVRAERYDVVVNNAGVGTVGSFSEVPIDKLVAMMHLNCDALVRISHAFLSGARSGDALVNVSSTLAYAPMPYLGLYSATKAFVTAFTETLWFEQRKRGVHVMGLHPGITSTGFQRNAGGRDEDLPKGLAQTPEEVAECCVRELERRRGPSVISGGKNAAFAAITRVLPRRVVMTMMSRSMKG